MSIAIFGAGGVGGYFGGLLADAGHDVTFIARGRHLDAILEKGLRISSVNGDFHIPNTQATDDPDGVGPVDYVVVAVKHYQLRNASGRIQPLIGEDTTVVPLLNGVDAHEILAETTGAGRVVGGLCSLVSYVEAPGIIRQASKLRRVVVGELDHKKSTRVENLVQAWHATGAEAVHADDIHVAMWSKFLFITSFSGIGSIVRAPAGVWRDVSETRRLFHEALKEVESLARACGVALAENVVDNALSMTDSFEPSATASMQRDVVDGNVFELEAFSGKIVRLGEKLGVPTPVHSAFYALLRPLLVQALQHPG